ncbi:class I SAM-dependent methyltransferase [Solihabitans fulvus]|uniref:Class I SAM-dependent methyltransferase n=1 Tax=Solihabitans fulvus TaxID=1892852 RepID=A0A5B2WZL2_9PSEU|nr:methyltransferase domain-containing protein [Solihabitans fulvus]KAA2255899.1 class I SAM-dependent methyltransferase [Solihabitans fulvus]
MAEERVDRSWNWEDPAGLGRRMDEFTVDLARCDSLETVATGPKFTRRQLADLGVTGIEFAAFRTAHPSGLGTDLVGLQSPHAATEPGSIYRVDGSSLYTQLDVAEPLPFEDGSVEWVYAEHLIEHIPLPVAVDWLTEVRRVLAPGGLLRITTPDLRRYVEGYLSQDKFFAKHRRRVQLAIGIAPPMPARPAFMFNQIFYLYGHRWIYDETELRHVLARAGFDDDAVRVRAYRDGARQDVADLDQTIRNDETIYVEVSDG